MEESQNQPQQTYQESGFSSNDRTPVSFPEPKNKENGSPIGLIIVIVVLALLLGGGGFLIYANKDSLPFIGAEPTATPTPVTLRVSPTEFEPSPTPEEVKIDKAVLSVNVLNGTGISGEAGVMQKNLEKLGYSKITVGNASKQNYVATEITYSSTVPEAAITEIVKELEKSYQEVKSKKATVSKGDIEVIVGYKKGYSASPTSKPTSATPTPTKAASASGTLTPTKAPTPTGN